jgi:hypothetical protein
LAKYFHFVKPYDYIFVGGNYGIMSIGFGPNIDLRYSQLIKVNSYDYDLLVNARKQPALIEFPYAVFVDGCAFCHPDEEICYGTSSRFVAEAYHKEINAFFDKIEELYKLKIIIAAHPKALMYQEKNPFNGRQVIFSKTPELIKDAQFMLLHNSTCMGIATVFEIPMVFLTSGLFKKHLPYAEYDLMTYFANYFNAEFLFYDQYNGGKLNLFIDKPKYKQYKYDYLTSPESENKTTEEIFLQFLKQEL